MKKNLSKTLAMMVILSSIGGNTVQVLATPNIDSNIENISDINKNMIKILPEILEKGKVLEKDEFLIKFKNNDEVKDYIDSVEKIQVNGIEYEKSYGLSKNQYIFSVNFGGLVINSTSLIDGENEILIKATGYNDNIIKISRDDIKKSNIDNKFSDKPDKMVKHEKLEKETSLNSMKELKEKAVPIINNEKEIKEISKSEVKANKNEETVLSGLNNNLEDGIYTLAFDAYKLNSDESSMLGKFFDKNIKLEVKNKKMTLTFLNTIFADELIDFRLGINNEFPKTSKAFVGEPDATGAYSAQSMTVPVEDLTKDNIVGVLVRAMGGQKSDIGNMSQYRQARLLFKDTYKKGWDGFIYSSNRISDDEKLNKALIEAGLDINGDKEVSEEELSNASGTIDLSGCEIKDISKLKHLGSGVEKLFLSGNLIESLPKGIFDNLTNLKTLSLTTNNINFLPKGIFDKLINLKELQLSNNKIKYIQDGTFDKLKNLKSISLYSNDLENLSDNIFNETIELEGLYLNNNKLNKIPNSILKSTKLKSLYLNNNNIKDIPKGLGNLQQLKDLYLQHNHITNIPEELYNLKKLSQFNIRDNEIKEIKDNIEKQFPNAVNIDVSLNELKDSISCDLEKVKVYPQKTQLKMILKAENGNISLNSQLSPLDILYWEKAIQIWDRTNTKKKPSNEEEFKTYLNGKKVLEALNDKGYDWTIKTEVQKKDKDGAYKTLNVIESEEKEFEPINYVDEDMLQNDEYRVITTVLYSKNGEKKLAFTCNVNTLAKVTENKIKKNEDFKLFEIKNNIEDTSEIGKEMVRRVLKDTTKVEIKNGRKYLTLDMDTQGYLKDIHTFINDKEIPYKEIKGEGNNLKIKLEVPSTDSKVGMKLFVIPMNRYVEFSVSHNKKSLKALESNLEPTLKLDLEKDNIEISNNKKNDEINSIEEIKANELKPNENKPNENKSNENNFKNEVLPRTGQPIGINILSILGSAIMGLGLLLKKKKRR